MKKRVIAAVTAAVTALACLGSCGKKEIGRDGKAAASQAETSAAESAAEVSVPDEAEEPAEKKFTGELKAPVADGKIDLSKGATENMLIRSLAYEGDSSRLAQKLKEAKELAESKEYTAQEKYYYPTEVVFMGDSVTTGYNASGDKKFASQFQGWWENNISFYAEWENAGLIATDSYVGVHRVDSDVLVHQPDIIFIEFVNDADCEDDRCKEAMDSLLRKCMSDEGMPAVILIETMREDGSSPQDMHMELAEAYGIPVISLRDAVMPEIDAGNITWEELFADEVHPNDLCHGLIAQMLENYVSRVNETADSAAKPAKFTAESPTGDKYKDAIISDSLTGAVWVSENNGFDEGGQLWYLQNGWGTVTGGDITFVVTCKKLGMLYNMSTDGEGGTARIIVDNKVIADIDSDFSGGWGDHCESRELFSNSKAEEHYVTVKVPKGKRFEVVRLLID